ncbi:MAG TPA: hypothetical protein PK736_01510 [Bacteroidia bacterium]|nr:hypothetical protein [Bacteroidia bacterium]
MQKSFNNQVKKIREIVNRFDSDSNSLKISLIRDIQANKILFNHALKDYHECLLFIMSFPPDEKTRSLAEREVLRISGLLKKQPEKIKELFVNSGIPLSRYQAAYSHDCTRWLLSHPDCTVAINEITNTSFDLNTALKVTIPAQLRNYTTAAYTNDVLLDELMPGKKLQLGYIINELSRLDNTPYVKDHYYEGLGIHTDIVPKSKLLSKAFNRIEIPETFYHSEIIKRFDVVELLNRKLPDEAVLSSAEKEKLVLIIKNSMAITERETDPATYMKEDSLHLFHLDRGVSVALYGLPAERQLPMESYIGYTMFKNGYPAAYAGGWVFGWRSDFGLNIYDQFRGGESAFMVAQILRVYRQLFNVNHFQVEASQFGLDSPEGIETGVFWFYYKLGFRPNDLALRQLAKSEHIKISSRKGYRSSEKTLLKFTESNISMSLGKPVQPGVYDITSEVKSLIIKKYRGNSVQAEKICVADFLTKTNCKDTFANAEFEVLKEVSLWAAAMNIADNDKLNLLLQMVKLKPVDEYRYQELLRLFFGDNYK